MFKKKLLHSIYFAFTTCIICACNPAKYVPNGSYLLKKNTIVTTNKDINLDDIQPLIKQKPNKRTLGNRLHLHLYNKGIKNYVYYSKNDSTKQKKQWFKNWLQRIGEKPVIYNQIFANQSSKQIQRQLENIGYFNSTVKNTVDTLNKSASVTYTIHTPKPYTIKSYINQVHDPILKLFMDQNMNQTLVKKGENFNLSTLDKERDRITFILKNKGYYYFSKDYIEMNIDSSLNNNELIIYLKILDPKNHSHVIQDINQVTIITDYEHSITQYDTLNYNGVFILYKDKLKILPNALMKSVFIKKGDWYESKKVNATYNKLADLNIFKFTNVILEPNNGSTRLLNCIIQLTPLQQNSISVALEGTNNSQSFGIGGNISFKNLNTFKGAEILNLKFSAITEWQQNFIDDNGGIIQNYELSPELNLIIPKLFLIPIHNDNLSQHGNPKTKISTSISSKQRPDYHRSLINFNYTWIYNESRFKQHSLSPFDINFIDLTLTESFENTLKNQNNPFLLNSYTDQFISAVKYSFTFNNQETNKPLHNFTYFKATAEGSYDLFNKDFSEYSRLESDYRYYYHVNERSSVVTRIYGGLAVPYNKSISVPFVKSFFAGGTNGIRAWQARSLGPGSFQPSKTFDQIGDIKLEFNLEYRFDIIGVFKGAFFTDIGNVWAIKEDASRPGANFTSNFFKELAIGSGVGLRLDFNFFIFRVDAGFPLKNPVLPEGYRFRLSNITMKSTVINLGIGYPF